MSFDTINLEKGMYTGKGFSATLEELDPSENYVGTELEGLDAFSRQLKRFDIKVSGTGSDTISKFFATTQSAALFPEYVSRAVKQGMEEADMLSQIVATKTLTDSLDYRTIYSDMTDDDKALATVKEGGFIPETDIKTKDHLIKLHKRGRMLVSSYEALKFQRIDLFGVTLKQIGAYIARQQFADAVKVLKNGDGNRNAAEVISAAESGVLSYADLLSLYSSLYPYEMNRIIVSPKTMMEVLSLDEFKNPCSAISFQNSGKTGNPLGASILQTKAVDDGELIALDSKCALEMVIASPVSVDYDKLIDRQLERAAITTTAGFAKIFTDASKVLKV